MKFLGVLIALEVIAICIAPFGVFAARNVDFNKLANFITIKEYMHCAQYNVALDNVALVNRNVPPPAARPSRIEMAGGFIAAALKIDRSLAADGIAPAKTYIATLSLTEMDRRYKIICTRMDKARQINNRLYVWRYRLNARLPVPAAFYKMRFDGPMPPERYLKD